MLNETNQGNCAHENGACCYEFRNEAYKPPAPSPAADKPARKATLRLNLEIQPDDKTVASELKEGAAAIAGFVRRSLRAHGVSLLLVEDRRALSAGDTVSFDYLGRRLLTQLLTREVDLRLNEASAALFVRNHRSYTNAVSQAFAEVILEALPAGVPGDRLAVVFSAARLAFDYFNSEVRPKAAVNALEVSVGGEAYYDLDARELAVKYDITFAVIEVPE